MKRIEFPNINFRQGSPVQRKIKKRKRKLREKDCLSNNLHGSSQTNTKRKIKHTNIYKKFHEAYNVTLEYQDLLRSK